MTEQELRSLVREAIARHINPPETLTSRASSSTVHRHASHALFLVPSGADAEGPCIIEPAVACTHCGYCKSLGH